MERATFFSMRREHTLKGVILDGPGVAGDASTWLDGFAMSWGSRSSGGYPDLEALFKQQSKERDRSTREALLHQIQRGIADRVMLAPFFRLPGMSASIAGSRNFVGGCIGKKGATYAACFRDLTNVWGVSRFWASADRCGAA